MKLPLLVLLGLAIQTKAVVVSFEDGLVGSFLDNSYLFANGTLKSEYSIFDVDTGASATFAARFIRDYNGKTSAAHVLDGGWGFWEGNVQHMSFQVDFISPVKQFEVVLTSPTYGAPGRYWGLDSLGNAFTRTFRSESSHAAIALNPDPNEYAWTTHIEAGLGEEILGFYLEQDDAAPIELYLRQFSYDGNNRVPETLPYGWLFLLVPFALHWTLKRQKDSKVAPAS